MFLFSHLIESKLKIKKVNRYESIDSFVSYLEFLGFFGKIDEIYISLRLLDRVYIHNNKYELVKYGVYTRLDSLIKKTEEENTYDIKRYFLNKENEGGEVYSFLSSFLANLINKDASHEENLILNFLLNVAISNNALINDLPIKLVNYLCGAKNCNNYRKDYCIFSIVDFCIKNNNNSFFKLRKQYYNHIQKIYSRIYKSQLLTVDEKSIYQVYFSSQIKKNNNLKSKTGNKVAVCFSGLYRNHIEAIESIKKNIIDPLNADVFIHTWDEKSIWNGIGGTPLSHRLFGSAAATVIPKEIKNLQEMQVYLPRTFDKIKDPIFEKWDGNEITDILNPKKILIESQEKFESSLIDKKNYLLARGSLNQIKMFYSIKQSFDLALETNDYDYIVRIRPDLLVKNEVSIDDIYCLKNNTIYTGVTDVGLQDVEFILSSSMAYNFSNFVNKMFDFNSLSPYEEFPLYCSHALMLSWILESNYLQDKSLLNRILLNMSERKVSIKDLSVAVEEDFSNLSEDNKSNFSPFLEYLKTNYC